MYSFQNFVDTIDRYKRKAKYLSSPLSPRERAAEVFGTKKASAFLKFNRMVLCLRMKESVYKCLEMKEKCLKKNRVDCEKECFFKKTKNFF